MARILARPPRAAMYLVMMSSAVCAERPMGMKRRAARRPTQRAADDFVEASRWQYIVRMVVGERGRVNPGGSIQASRRYHSLRRFRRKRSLPDSVQCLRRGGGGLDFS